MSTLKTWQGWLHALASHFITGAASAIVASVGTGVINEPLSWTQLGAIFLTNGVIGAMAYLKNSPLPKVETDDEPTQ